MIDLPALLRSRLVDVPDFPTPGVLYRDISPLLADHVAFAGAVDAAVAVHGRGTLDKVLGVEARGFLFGAPVAYHAGAGFVAARKPGKLPRAVHEARYDLEYGTDALQVHADALAPGERVLVVDDVLATGGTAAAALDLVRQAGAEPVGLVVLVELEALGGRARLAAAHPTVEVSALLAL